MSVMKVRPVLTALWLAAALLPAAAAWAHPHPDAQAGAAAGEALPERSDASKFLRFVDDDVGGGELQTSVVRYKNATGQHVDLIGAVHVGDRAYYRTLDRRFEDYDALLYELVMPEGERPPRMGARREPADANLISMLQQMMKTVLELDFQLDGIDYRAENFVHADLSAERFAELQTERGEGFLELLIRSLLNPPPAGEAQPMTLNDLMLAFQAPDRARQLKLLFAQQMRQMDQMLAMLEGPDGSVIVTERNKRALEVLQEQLQAGAEDVGIFYGAAHLPDMEQRLRAMGFEQAGEPEYLTAWDMTADEE